VKEQYHREITLKALNNYFRPDALETVVAANLGQDALRYQIGHDHFHYDSNSFAAGDEYCEEQRQSIVAALKRSEALPARKALGRLTHTVQDLYAHSNYVALWRELHPQAASDEIDPELATLLSHSRLHSGKLYYPLEALSFIAAFKPYILPLLPRDSHAWMNIDGPERPDFKFALTAALKRTSLEYLRIVAKLSPKEVAFLTDLEK
jgi:hypothetical protein